MTLLTVADVAKIRRTGRVAAWRWLSRNAGRHFLKRGRERVISDEVYRRLALSTYIDDKLAKVETKLDILNEELAELTKRFDALVRRVENLRIR